MVKISDAWLRSIQGKPYSGTPEVSLGDSLFARISPKGKIVWMLRASLNGQRLRMTIGRYPGMKISEARSEKSRIQDLISDGIDPRKLAIQEKIKKLTTINDVISYWVENYAKQNIVRWRQFESMFHLDVCPYIGTYPVHLLKQADYIMCFQRARERVGPKHSANLMGRLKSVFQIAVRHGMIDVNPLQALRKEDVGESVGIRRTRQREVGIGVLWNAISEISVHPSNKNFLRLMCIFANRGNELRLAKKHHFDLKNGIWTVPTENNKIRKKGGGEIIRPIPTLAEQILRVQFAMYPDFAIAFPPVVKNADRPMSSSVLVAFGAKLGDHMQNLGLPRTTNHDMRRTARNTWAEFGIDHKVGEAMLGHIVHTGVTSNYLEYNYMQEQKEAYEKWCAYILEQSDKAKKE